MVKTYAYLYSILSRALEVDVPVISSPIYSKTLKLGLKIREMEGVWKVKVFGKLWTFTKIIACIVCLVGFVANSLYISKQFIGGKTVTSENIKKYQKLGLPSVTICSVSGFKKKMNETDDLELENYLNEKSMEDMEVCVG